MNNKPVAWMNEEEIGIMYAMKIQGAKDWKTNLGLVPEENDIPLYTHPAKTLTEWEMKECWEEATEGREHFCSQYFDFAQLILKKASEK